MDKSAGEAQDGSLEKNRFSQVSSEVLRPGSVSNQAEVEMWSCPENMRIKRDLQVVGHSSLSDILYILCFSKTCLPPHWRVDRKVTSAKNSVQCQVC